MDRCGWTGRARVVRARSEEAGRNPDLRGTFALVVARSFATPPVTAEAAAPFLRPDGLLLVSEPPSEPRDGILRESGPSARWPRAPLADLGLAPLERYWDGFGFAVLRQVVPCPDRFPRRTGIPGKRPLYQPDAGGSGSPGSAPDPGTPSFRA